MSGPPAPLPTRWSAISQARAETWSSIRIRSLPLTATTCTTSISPKSAKARILGDGTGPLDSDIQLKVRAGSNLAKSLVRTAWRTQDSDWDAEIAEVGAADLIARASVAINGWSGPAWLRTGWFQTYLLLGELAGNEDLRATSRTAAAASENGRL